MGTMTPTEFVPEGGKLHLANRLHALYRFNIRCPSCPGNRGMAGFIRSQSRKPDKKNRLKRRFNCQRHEKCAHLSCREFIELARRHLSSEVFRAVVRTVCSDFPAKNLGIRQYLLDSESEPTLSQVPGDIYTENTQAVRPPQPEAEETSVQVEVDEQIAREVGEFGLRYGLERKELPIESSDEAVRRKRRAIADDDATLKRPKTVN